MKIRAVFIGSTKRAIDQIVECIEAASSIEIDAVKRECTCRDLRAVVAASDAVFVDRAVETRSIEKVLRLIRQHCSDIPVVITYQDEPDGRTFVLARRYDCLLFSPKDKLGITLTPAEVATALEESLSAACAEQKLMEISLCTGPCSTGD
jgi:hypothetical protein